MFLGFYGLTEQPFGFTPNPRYLYPTPALREAFACLVCAIENNLGFAAAIGEPGTGKTSLLFTLLHKYSASAETALILHPDLDEADLLRYIMREFKLPDCGFDKVASYTQLNEFLASSARQRKRVILIIDEAQNITRSTLEAIRLLSNFETPTAKLLNIILSGQPGLADRLSSLQLSQLRQRIPIIARLRPLDRGETAAYIEHRLKVAGYSGPPLFAHSAIQRIFLQSAGIPRNVNSICFNALSLGCATRRRTIDVDILDEVTADLDLRRSSSDHDQGVKTETARQTDRFPDSGSVPEKPKNRFVQSARHVPTPTPVEPGSAEQVRSFIAANARPRNDGSARTMLPANRDMSRIRVATQSKVKRYGWREIWSRVPRAVIYVAAVIAVTLLLLALTAGKRSPVVPLMKKNVVPTATSANIAAPPGEDGKSQSKAAPAVEKK